MLLSIHHLSLAMEEFHQMRNLNFLQFPKVFLEARLRMLAFFMILVSLEIAKMKMAELEMELRVRKRLKMTTFRYNLYLNDIILIKTIVTDLEDLTYVHIH